MRRLRKNMTIFLVFAMILQIVAPVASNFVFAAADEAFRIDSIDFKGDTATVNWEFDFDSNDGPVNESYSIQGDFILDEEISSRSFKADAEEGEEGTFIGTYTVSRDGRMEVSIYDNLEDKVRELLEEELESGEFIIQSKDTEQSVPEDVYEPEEPGPVKHSFKGSFEVEGIVPLNDMIQSFAEIEEKLISSFEMTISDKEGKPIEVEDGKELDIDEIKAVELVYTLKKSNDVVLKPGDTYTIDLPDIFKDVGAPVSAIEINGEVVGTYVITSNKTVITFTGEVEKFDNVEMFVNIKGEFNTKIFETEQEVEVNVPYQDGTSYSITIKAKQQEHNGEDKKKAGFQYVLDGEDRIEVDKNPEYIDWTVRVNDNMGSFKNATIIDDLGKNLEIDKGSFIVERIIRNYKNEEIRREPVTNFEVEYKDAGFELDLGDIGDAYDITYTTKIIRPDGGGRLTINNNARIILDNDETKVSDKFTGTWSGDLPVIDKEGGLSDNPHVIDWKVKYNFGKEDLGTVTLTDTLSHGEVDLTSVKVYEVEVDIDGNIIGEKILVKNVVPVITDKVMTLPYLDANGKAYYITFSSSVPVGLDDTVINTIEDDLKKPNSDSDTVDVNTIPTGGKVGEQKVDNEGRPYIKWTITMNSNKVDVPSITVRDVFDKTYLEFDVNNTSLYKLYKNGEEVTNFTIKDYEHEDGREGFKLDISNAGPHEYKFVYRTYYTTEGMNQPELANHAELVFLDGVGQGIGKPVPLPDAVVKGPEAGINKSGRYDLNTEGDQEILWAVNINQSKISLDAGSTITEDFISGNYTYIENSLSLKDGSTILNLGEDYSLSVDGDEKGFVITLLKATKATLTLTFRTITDDTNNASHENKATLKWQGGEEPATSTVGKRDPGSNKTGTVVINEDGSKTVKWTINFNTNQNVIHNFKLVDTYTPTTVTVRDIKITSGGEDVTGQFKISPDSPETTGGEFTVSKAKLDAKSYQLTYSTTLSPEEEKQEIKNTAAITYRGGEENPSNTIKSPTLGVQKEAVRLDKKTENGDIINWKITANTDTANHLVNLVNPVLTDTIPTDQKLVEGSIKVEQVTSGVDANVNITDSVTITPEDNKFTINLPDGPYQYIVTFQTKILEYPSVGQGIGIYTNETTLSNTGYKEVSDDAWIDYFADKTNNNNAKTGIVNDDTENIDWEATVNPLGLTINNAKITDILSDNQTYLIDENNKIVVKAGGTELTEGEEGHYTLVMEENKRSFTITFNNEKGTINEPITVLYSTRLNPELIGNITVTNSIKLTGGESSKELSTITTVEKTSQWTYGGGGVGRTLNFKLNKVSPEGTYLAGAKFTLSRVDIKGTVIPVDVNIITDANGLYSSGQIRAGRYILTETEAPEGYKETAPIYFIVGYTETPGKYEITIMNNQWIEADNPNATAEGNVLTVVNNYKSGSFELVARKILEGQNLTDGQFKFELLDFNGVVETVENNADGSISFTLIDTSEFEDGSYEYTIQEVEGSLGGITYDETKHKVTVTVTNGEPTVSYKNGPVEFTNKYVAAPDSIVLQAEKILEGQKLINDQFMFELLDADGTVLQTKKNNAEGKIFFDEIKYNEVGNYTYVIREIKGEQGGVTYDNRSYTVVVNVIDDGEGKLLAKANYIDGSAEFANTYTPNPDSVVIVASKMLEGQNLRNGQFAFELADAGGKVIQTKQNNADGQIIFDEITYETGGEYKYTIREVVGSQGGVTYDDTIYEVVVNVADDRESTLTAEVEYVDGPAEFENIYTPEADRVVLEASKVLEGQDLRKGQFTFKLLDADGNVLQTKENNAQGQIIFDEITYDALGEFTYTIVEVEGSQGGITYDNTVYEVIVTVTDNDEGSLIATEEYVNSPAVFKNTYTPAPNSVVLEARKALRGQTLRNGQFTFDLLDSEGNIIQTVNNNGEGQIIFDEITYEAVDEFNYTIVEQRGSQSGMTYDRTKYKVIVNVIDDGEGSLVAEVEYIDGPAVFNNTYRPTGPGGGGPGPEEPPRPPKPTDPVDPPKPTDPVDPEKPPTDPEVPVVPPTVEKETPPDTPIDIEVPKGGVPEVKNPPENGTVTVDEDGNWTYTPNPGFEGKDRFSIITTDPDGTEEEIFFEIDVLPPLGGVEAQGEPKEEVPTLPKTGQMNSIVFYVLGLFVLFIGIVLRKKTA